MYKTNQPGTTSRQDSASNKVQTHTLSLTGLFLLAATSFLWGSAFPFVKIALVEIPIWTFRSVCLVCSGLFLVVLTRGIGSKLFFPRNELRSLILVSLLNITGWHVLSAYGISCMNAGRAVIIGFTMPVWASILGIFILGERLSARRISGLVLGMTGLAILLLPDIKILGFAPIGAMFMLASAVSWAAGTVFIRYFRWTLQTAPFSAWQFIFGGIPVVIGAIIFEPSTAIFHLSLKGTLATVYVAMVCIPLGWWAWFKVLTMLPTSVSALGTVAAPVIGVLSSALVIQEPLGLQEISAMLCVATALAIVLTGPGRFGR